MHDEYKSDVDSFSTRLCAISALFVTCIIRPLEVKEPCTYLCGNSLGILPKRSSELVKEELDVWATRYDGIQTLHLVTLQFAN